MSMAHYIMINSDESFDTTAQMVSQVLSVELIPTTDSDYLTLDVTPHTEFGSPDYEPEPTREDLDRWTFEVTTSDDASWALNLYETLARSTHWELAYWHDQSDGYEQVRPALLHL